LTKTKYERGKNPQEENEFAASLNPAAVPPRNDRYRQGDEKIKNSHLGVERY
jgi:hypothetical protein